VNPIKIVELTYTIYTIDESISDIAIALLPIDLELLDKLAEIFNVKEAEARKRKITLGFIEAMKKASEPHELVMAFIAYEYVMKRDRVMPLAKYPCIRVRIMERGGEGKGGDRVTITAKKRNIDLDLLEEARLIRDIADYCGSVLLRCNVIYNYFKSEADHNISHYIEFLNSIILAFKQMDLTNIKRLIERLDMVVTLPI
jgi:hypothetical protein